MFQAIVSAIITGLVINSGLIFLLAKPSAPLPSIMSGASAPVRVISPSRGIDISAASAVVVDNASGAILFAKQPNDIRPLASITKLMTALVSVNNQADWHRAVMVTDADRRDGDIDRFIVGESFTLLDLFNVMLVASSNDAASAVARAVSGHNFVALMNESARQLGMVSAIFTDPTGLAPTNIASATDLARLARTAFAREEIRRAALLPRYEFSPLGSSVKRSAPATDQLLGSFLNQPPYEIIGAKTGFTDEAGYCLVLMVRRDGHDIIIVLLGAASAPDRWQEAKGLVDWVFANYRWGTI